MPPDAHKNFAYSTVATAPSPASSGTSLVVASGEGTRFPAVPFNATVWPAGALPIPTNAEIVRVTTVSTDTFTITRTQEGTSARSIVVGDQIAATITAKTLTDAETMVVLHDEVLSSSAASFDVQNIPQGYRHLMLLVQGRGTTAATAVGARLRFNNDSGANYDAQDAYGSGGSSGASDSYGGTFIPIVANMPAASASASRAAIAQILIPGYADTTFYKEIVSPSSTFYAASSVGGYVTVQAGQWRSTAAINRITLYPSADNFAAGSRLTIYGL